MPCQDQKHFDTNGNNLHYWVPQGALRIWPCERECGFCGFRARDSSQLRSHVREIHVAQDYPEVTVMVGQRRPPLFCSDETIHGTAHLKAQYEDKSPLKSEEKPAGQAKNPIVVDKEDESKERGQDETDDAHPLEPAQSSEAGGTSVKSDGTPTAVKTRSRNIQVTEKAAAAAADEMSRKRKRTAPIKGHPHESFPSRSSPRTTNTYTGTPDRNGAGAHPTAHAKGKATTNGQAVNGLDPKEQLYANITRNVTGLLELADACELDRLRVYDAANDGIKKWLLSQSNTKDQ